jgi:hypothetical protein
MSPFPTTSTNLPVAHWAGQIVFETNTNLLKIYNGTSWKTVLDAT